MKSVIFGPTREDDSDFLSGLHTSSKSDVRCPTSRLVFPRLVVEDFFKNSDLSFSDEPRTFLEKQFTTEKGLGVFLLVAFQCVTRTCQLVPEIDSLEQGDLGVFLFSLICDFF